MKEKHWSTRYSKFHHCRTKRCPKQRVPNVDEMELTKVRLRVRVLSSLKLTLRWLMILVQ